MTQDEMEMVDGGDFGRNLGYACATVCCVGATIVTGPLAGGAALAAAGWYWYDAVR
ncbi:hypothetical protein SAMN02745248_00371 [Hathewaya proteolytica DSM 3090]|uniref:Uncharacterized protein n=2 Tax=Hathewaya proteolytica TaxID=29365 RepID=A0A1M6K886_9CLOT|nr:hypothetical protein SAMN02745248_00371 [Hathewaya proteolytica DSM 3090]